MVLGSSHLIRHVMWVFSAAVDGLKFNAIADPLYRNLRNSTLSARGGELGPDPAPRMLFVFPDL
jgi:hypothetical protein